MRLVDGRPVAGRYIEESAYALYLWAADAEARGDLAAAQRGFEQAALADPESPEIWTRIGALRCRAETSGRPYRAALSARLRHGRGCRPGLRPGVPRARARRARARRGRSRGGGRRPRLDARSRRPRDGPAEGRGPDTRRPHGRGPPLPCARSPRALLPRPVRRPRALRAREEHGGRGARGRSVREGRRAAARPHPCAPGRGATRHTARRRRRGAPRRGRRRRAAPSAPPRGCPGPSWRCGPWRWGGRRSRAPRRSSC